MTASGSPASPVSRRASCERRCSRASAWSRPRARPLPPRDGHSHRPPDPSRLVRPSRRQERSGARGLLIRIVAENFAFDLAEFSVPADTPFQIEFDHRDVKIPHNVAIYDSGAEGPALFRGEIFSGPDVVTYDVPGLPRGVHHFTCDPHPYMAGAVTVT